MAQPPLLIWAGNSESRFACMNARTTKCQNWRRHADTIAHKSEKMANLQSAVIDRRYSGSYAMRIVLILFLLAPTASAQSMPEVRTAVTLALPLLQRSAAESVAKRACFSC